MKRNEEERKEKLRACSEPSIFIEGFQCDFGEVDVRTKNTRTLNTRNLFQNRGEGVINNAEQKRKYSNESLVINKNN